jgi:hypothetical protein
MDTKFLIAGIFFVLIILTGLWLSHLGKPINVFVMTVHKLISLAALVFLAITAYRIQQVTPMSPLAIIACAVTLFFFIIMIATGGLLSAAKPMPVIVLRIHQIMPLLVVIATSITLYLLLIRKQ